MVLVITLKKGQTKEFEELIPLSIFYRVGIEDFLYKLSIKKVFSDFYKQKKIKYIDQYDVILSGFTFLAL